jgi:hypothetical protein
MRHGCDGQLVVSNVLVGTATRALFAPAGDLDLTVSVQTYRPLVLDAGQLVCCSSLQTPVPDADAAPPPSPDAGADATASVPQPSPSPGYFTEAGIACIPTPDGGCLPICSVDPDCVPAMSDLMDAGVLGAHVTVAADATNIVWIVPQ